MKFCHKHTDYILSLDEKANMNKIIHEFVNIVPIEKQEKIDNTKSSCPICYLGKDYKMKLKDIVNNL